MPTTKHLPLFPFRPQKLQAAFNSLLGVMAKDKASTSLYETRHYYINVEKCLLDLTLRPVGVTYLSGVGQSNPINSWSMRYTKSRRRLEVHMRHALTAVQILCLLHAIFLLCLIVWTTVCAKSVQGANKRRYFEGSISF